MKKDIEIPIATTIAIAAIYEWNNDSTAKIWNAYLINQGFLDLELLMVVSKGYVGADKTSVLRHNLGSLAPQSFKKVELLHEALFAFNNEFFVTFFSNNKLYEKKILFPENSMSENNLRMIPLMGKEGVLAA